MIGPALPLFAVFALAAVGAPPGPSRPIHERRPGGPELVLAPSPGARTASLRIVVRAGSAADPFVKAGLAHLVEHLLMRDPGGTPAALLGDAHAAGATLNAFTSRAATWFALDAPAAAFPPLAQRLLRAVTDPRLDDARVDREREIIQREQGEMGGQGAIASLLDSALFPVGPPETTVLGDGSSRDQIERRDLLTFFQRNYASSAITIVMTGAVTEEQARGIFDASFLLPPALPTEGPEPSDAEPSLPATLKIRASFIAAVYGYRLDAADRAPCEALAALLERRLVDALTLDNPVLRAVDVGCYAVRGSEFILAFGHAPSLDATNVSNVMEWGFGSIRRQPPDAAERSAVERRLERLDAARRDDPARLADAIVDEALRARPSRFAPVPPGAGRVDAAGLSDIARRAFTPERRVLLLLSPFEG
jgi:predicted Zn-dependent peptidase